MTYVQQIGRTCGQACIAMLLDVTLDEACELVGHRHGTQTRELVAALRKHGWKTSNKLVRAKFPEHHILSICKFSCRRDDGRMFGGWHWVVWAEGRFWNPDSPRRPGCVDFGWVSSQLTLERPRSDGHS